MALCDLFWVSSLERCASALRLYKSATVKNSMTGNAAQEPANGRNQFLFLGGCSQIYDLRREWPVPAISKVSFPLFAGIFATWAKGRNQPIADRQKPNSTLNFSSIKRPFY